MTKYATTVFYKLATFIIHVKYATAVFYLLGILLTHVNIQLQSNLCKTTTLGSPQKWSSWTVGHFIKQLHKTITSQM